MKNIILAAGYATRLYPITENFPKPLLQIGGKTILDRLLNDLDTLDEIDEHILVCNHTFLPHFEKWQAASEYSKKIRLIDDGSTTNDNRLGAVRDLFLAIETQQLWNDDQLAIAADNVLTFSFQGFIDFFKEKQTSVIMTCFEPELKALQRTGVIVLDANRRVLEMQEKPQTPKSHNAVPPLYIYKKTDLALAKSCITGDKMMDAPGLLVTSMLPTTVFHAWQMPGKRGDIGTLEICYQYKDNFP
jgi:glucose-1-phosphate thymidylyltransferase